MNPPLMMFSAAAALIILFLGYTLPFKTPLDILHNNSIWEIEHSKNIYLTFDDGPNPQATITTLNLLRRSNQTATFFLIPENVGKYPEIVKRIHQENHTIGLHGKSRFLAFNEETFLNNYIGSFQKDMSEILKENFKLRYFRPPSGWRSPALYKVLKKQKINLVGWSPFCWPDSHTKDKEEIIKKTKKCIKPGKIVVFHDSDSKEKDLERIELVGAFPEILENLRNKNIKSKSL